MPPQQYQYPAPPPQPEQQNPYDFFMEQEGPKQRGGGLGNSPLKKALLIVGLFVGVLTLLGVILAIVSHKPNNTAPLITIAQDQQELIRIASDGAKHGRSTTIQNYAVTAESSLTSAQSSLVAFMAKQGIKVNAKSLDASHSPTTDQALATALTAETYDSTFTSISQAALAKYIRDLNQEISVAPTRAEATLLQQQNAYAQLLQKQLSPQ